MWGVIEALIGRLPDEMIAWLVPVLLAVGVWVFTHLRVDKQGKRYWYSQKYEDLKRNKKQDKILDLVTMTKEEMSLLDIRLLRIEIMDSIARGDSIRVVSDLYDKYKAIGGNSYIDHKYNDYYNYESSRDMEAR
jgi:hypothetical protein